MIIQPEKNLYLAETSYELLQQAGWIIQQDLQSTEQKDDLWYTSWFAAHAGTGQVVKIELARDEEPNSESYKDFADELVEFLAGWPNDNEEDDQ